MQLAPQQLAGLNRLEAWLETRSPVLWWCTSSTRWDTPSSRSRARPRPASCRGALPPEPGNTSWRERAPHHAHHSTAWPTSQLASPQPLPTTLGTRLPARQSSWRKCRPRPFDQAARRSHFRGRPSAHCAHSSTACTLAPGSHSSRRAQRSETAGGKEATTPTLVGKLLRHRPALLAFPAWPRARPDRRRAQSRPARSPRKQSRSSPFTSDLEIAIVHPVGGRQRRSARSSGGERPSNPNP